MPQAPADRDYPEKTCSIERLIRHPRLVAAALGNKKTQQRRDGVYAYPGETFKLENEVFQLTSLTRQRLGDMTDSDAMAEGYPNLAAYKELIIRMHPGMSWDEEHRVWVHHFARQT